MDVKSIILATEEKDQMKSKKVKVLHELLGKPLISYPIRACKAVSSQQICVVIESQKQAIQATLGDGLAYTLKADGLIAAVEFAQDSDNLIILNGDAPLIRGEILEELLAFHLETNNGISILRPALEVTGSAQIHVFKAGLLKSALGQRPDDRKLDYCLGGIVELLLKDGCDLGVMEAADRLDLLRVHSRSQLAQCAAVMKSVINEGHMDNGVTLEDPSNTYIESDVVIGQDTIIGPNCILKGKSTIGSNCLIGYNTNITNTQIANGVKIENSQVQDSFIDEDAHIGPFAYIRPDSKIGKGVRIGDFVEIKNSTIGDYTKVSHLTYVGDADVGKHVNFGCGSVLVNYDGVNKHRSTIEDYAFIGCNTNLVSPVKIGEGAYTAAGSTITLDVPKESLGISRGKQVNKEGWVAYKRPKS